MFRKCSICAMVRHRLDSVSDFARQGYNLRLTCNGCGRIVEASAPLMMQELSRRHASQSIEKLEERVKCQECGHRGASITACEINF